MAKHRGQHRYAGQLRPGESKREQAQRILRTGYATVNDLNRSYQEGYKKGHDEGTAWGMDCVYGSIMLALHRLHGFGAKRLYELVMEATRIQVEEFSTQDILDRLKDECGVEMPMVREITAGGGV